MARAAKLDLRAFQMELATRLAAKTTAQVEQSRLGIACAGRQWLIRLADAGEVIALPLTAVLALHATAAQMGALTTIALVPAVWNSTMASRPPRPN